MAQKNLLWNYDKQNYHICWSEIIGGKKWTLLVYTTQSRFTITSQVFKLTNGRMN